MRSPPAWLSRYRTSCRTSSSPSSGRCSAETIPANSARQISTGVTGRPSCWLVQYRQGEPADPALPDATEATPGVKLHEHAVVPGRPVPGPGFNRVDHAADGALPRPAHNPFMQPDV